jgi:1-phosphofructokinase
MNLFKPNILCISLTPALDHYITVENLEFGKINRCLAVEEHAGGKSINGARAIKQVGGEPLVVCPLGGHHGDTIIDYAQKEGIDLISIPTKSETRQYTEIWDVTNNVSTHLSEHWSHVTPQEWSTYIELIKQQITQKTKFNAAIIAGGTPPGVDHKEMTTLVKTIQAAGVPCFIDSAGESLGYLLAAKPSVVKINASEASEYLDRDIASIQDVVGACKHFISLGVEACVITLGEDGAIGAKGDEIYHVTIDNKGLMPVGSGDSFLGAMAVKWSLEEQWGNILIAGAAAGTANSHLRISGMLDLAVYDLGLKTAKIEILAG